MTEEISLRLFVIAEIRLYREGLAEVLARLPDVAEVGTAAESGEGLARVRVFRPHIVLLDMSVLNSAETVRELVRMAPAVQVVAIGVPDTEDHVVACAEAGVSGYVAREGTLGDLVLTVRAVARGETVCSPRISAGLMRRVAALAELGQTPAPCSRLTVRETQIVQLVADGLANQEIARHLGIELCTVKNHVHHILEKLGVRRRYEVAAAVRMWNYRA